MPTSVIIPARQEPHLQRTIDSLLEAAAGEVEILVMLDDWWPEPPIREDARVVVVHAGDRPGMRSLINAGARLAKGEWLMKLDAHCMMAPAFDDVLKEGCADNHVLVPIRYGLDVKHWVVPILQKPFEFQYIRRGDLKGKNWPEYAERCDGKLVVPLMTTQGSCWFMKKSWFEHIGGLDDVHFGSMGREAQEVTIKTWLAGGHVSLDRRTWYAHWSKPKEAVIQGVRAEKAKSLAHATRIWTDDVLRPIVERFSPVPTWHDLSPKPRQKAVMREAAPGLPPIKHEGVSRADLYELFAERGYKIGAEIGVWDGVNARAMFEKIPGVKLYLVDPYEDYALARKQRGASRLEKALRRMRKNTKGYNAELLSMHSERAALLVPDGSLDFVYIDGNHKYDFVMLDIILWERKVRKGGVVAGHDYYSDRRHRIGVKEAVDDYVRYYGVQLNATDKMAETHGKHAMASWWWEKR